MRKRVMLAGAAVFCVACGGQPGELGVTESAAVSGEIPFRSLADGSDIARSEATLVRSSNNVLVKKIETYLEPDQEVEVFFAIFNNPEECTIGNPVTGVACGPPDLFNPLTNGSLQFHGLVAADEDGELKLPDIGYDPAKCFGAPFPCNTLSNPAGAEVHVPLFGPGGGAGVQAAQWLAP